MTMRGKQTHSPMFHALSLTEELEIDLQEKLRLYVIHRGNIMKKILVMHYIIYCIIK